MKRWIAVLFTGRVSTRAVERALVFTRNPNPAPSLILLGGVIGATAAGVLEYDTQHALGALPTVGVALIEEACKLLVPLGALLVLRRRTARPDGRSAAPSRPWRRSPWRSACTPPGTPPASCP